MRISGNVARGCTTLRTMSNVTRCASILPSTQDDKKLTSDVTVIDQQRVLVGLDESPEEQVLEGVGVEARELLDQPHAFQPIAAQVLKGYQLKSILASVR